MRDEELERRINKHPLYHHLKQSRRKIAFGCTLACLALCAVYILLVVFAPAKLSIALGAGGTLTIGLAFGLGLLLFSWLMTGIYISVANGRLDNLRDTLLEEVRQ